ncbi:hypothetical protein CHS0354_003686 [Potamilus streckersoni]|uniref:LRAT domain-containing protein n=1 Tax=Potamilus streckersoni TaxID=2493646 RepID=A0AAE0ST89_9BIVA|nr:hypothetical protein CHS0354_003686 [Potamilus streckersoni]
MQKVSISGNDLMRESMQKPRLVFSEIRGTLDWLYLDDQEGNTRNLLRRKRSRSVTDTCRSLAITGVNSARYKLKIPQFSIYQIILPEGKQDCLPPSIGCGFCSVKERLLSFKDLRPGDHICLGGQSYLRYVDREQKYLYKHHAIVKEVLNVKGTKYRALISCIHFASTPFDANLRIRETRELRDLKVDELYLVRYRSPKFQPQVVLDRAQKGMDHDPAYSIVFLNYEHFCNWCVTDLQFSSQVERVMESFLGSTAGPGMKIAKIIIQFAGITADDVTSLVLKCVQYAPTVIQSVFLLSFLFKNIYLHLELHKKLKAGQICERCCKFKLENAWLSFGFVSIPTILSIIAGLTIKSTAPLIAVLLPLSIISLGILWGSSKVLKTRKSPFRGEIKKVKDIMEIHYGDVIQYRYWGLQHEAIVSFVDGKTGTIGIIHYALESFLSKREIVEEKLQIERGKKDIFLLDYSAYTVYSPDDVVRRARQRVGEKKFGLFNNRSCHLCHWAKVDDGSVKPLKLNHDEHIQSDISKFKRQIYTDQSVGRARSTSLIRKVSAVLNTDVRAGDLIQFTYHNNYWHKAVCTNVIPNDTNGKLEIDVVHYSYEGFRGVPEVKEERFTFNLLEEDVFVYHYHPVHRYSRQDIIKRAMKKIGDKKYKRFRNSKHLAEYITLIDKEEVVDDPDELSEGDIVSFMYWGLRHKGVLVSVSGKSSDTNCEIRVKHYALMHWFATRTIVEETFKIDLKENKLHRISFSEYNTYPGNTVVMRARKRVGEQKFNFFSNTSNHLVHWAKVDNRMVIGVISPDAAEIEFNDPECKEALLQNVLFEKEEGISVYPTSGKTKSKMHIEAVKSWEELIPGRVVEYKYYWIWHKGILAEVLPNQCIIKIIHYGAKNLFATREVMLDEVVVNLRRDNYYIYHPDPEYAYKREDAIASAMARLGEQDWRVGNRSDDFCRTCILNPFAGEAKALLHMEHVKAWEGFVVGCIVDFRYRLKRHQGILTEVFSQQKELKVVHFGLGEKSALIVLEDLIEVDFVKETFYIYHPHEQNALQQDEAIKNARKSIGTKSWKSAYDFCKKCVLKM